MKAISADAKPAIGLTVRSPKLQPPLCGGFFWERLPRVGAAAMAAVVVGDTELSPHGGGISKQGVSCKPLGSAATELSPVGSLLYDARGSPGDYMYRVQAWNAIGGKQIDTGPPLEMMQALKVALEYRRRGLRRITLIDTKTGEEFTDLEHLMRDLL